METTDLTSAEYWESDENDIRLNPAAKLDPSSLPGVLRERRITSAIVLATSGIGGRAKLIVLSKRAMLCSAESVNQWCGITQNDNWLGGLSTFHVGGLSIFARAFLTGSRINPMAWNRWTRDGKAFIEATGNSTVTSLTPVHLHDLANARVRCPASLRGVLIGGGALSADLAERARELGWPIWTTYGMTEACSQIATSLEGELEWLPILPHWETRISEQGNLIIKGDALMEGYFSRAECGKWEWHNPCDEEGFYTTGDLVAIHGQKLKPLGRADDQVKILGELVSISKVEKSLSRKLGVQVVVFDFPDKRRGANLIALIESEDDLMEAYREWNETMPPYEQISEVRFVDPFPRTEVGKIDRQALLHHRENL